MSTACLACRKWDLETRRPLDGHVAATTTRLHSIGINGRPTTIVYSLCALCSELWDMDIDFEADGNFRNSSAMYAAADYQARHKGPWTQNHTNWGGWL